MANVVLLCLFWYFISTWSNVVTKSLLSEFPHPMSVTVIQLTVVSLLTSFWGSGRNVENKDVSWGYYLKFIVPLAFGKFVGNVLNHVSIWKVPVSYAHTVRASMPLFTVVLSKLILQEHQSVKIYLSLLPIIGGVAIATVTEISFNLTGLLSSLASTMTFSLQNIYSKKVMHDTGIHHLSLLSMISKLSLFMFLPIWLVYDARDMLQSLSAVEISSRTLALLLLDGFLNWLHNIAVFSVMSNLTPLTFAVASACKLIFVIAVTLVIIGNPVSTANVLGMALAITGVICYNKVKFEQRQLVIVKKALSR
ncbi:solute carrier family 35 member E1 homolog [Nasonia vitripennis]|uniref:Sugar phosphate transporter domain-containing protein n=1 Tax=Nasonia vitripennis TaxID=7425 RepID=A0A7M7LLG7_NASVI|nr:solute carrier family 35 member E1 homolog [Nasonia vitripennis]